MGLFGIMQSEKRFGKVTETLLTPGYLVLKYMKNAAEMGTKTWLTLMSTSFSQSVSVTTSGWIPLPHRARHQQQSRFNTLYLNILYSVFGGEIYVER